MSENLPPSNTTPLRLTNSDEIRHMMLAEFERVRHSLEAYHNYAVKISALSLEYHDKKLKETFPGLLIDELTLAMSLDARETPKSLDEKLSQLTASGVQVKHVIFDRVASIYHVFV